MYALRARPLTQRELCEVTGYTDRHVRRVIADLPGVVATRTGRTTTYSITTTPDNTGHQNVRYPTPDMTPDIPDSCGRPSDLVGLRRPITPDNTGHFDVRYPTPDITPDIPRKKAQKKKQPSKKPSNTGHVRYPTPDISDINTGHEHRASAQQPLIAERQGKRHRESPLSAPVPAPGADCPPDCTDRTCRSCPLSIATMERDTIQFVLVDQTFRDQVLRWVATRKWPHKEARGITWVYPGDHLTLQVGADSVVFYSDEPGNLEWIEAWVRRYFEASYPDIDSLLARIRSPERLTRDELTVVVTHQPTIDAVMGSIGMHMGPNKTFYLAAPNSNTPGFKAYLSAGTLRCEFDCRNQFQAISALGMRQRLLTILPEVCKAEGLFWEFLTDYYNPYEHPIVIDTGVESIVQQVSALAQNLSKTFADALAEALRDLRPAAPPQAPATTAPPLDDAEICPSEEEETAIVETIGIMRSMMESLTAMDSYELEEILRTFKTTMKLEERVTLVYLAAFAAWVGKNFRGSVIIEDLIPALEGVGMPLSAAEIADAIDDLKTAGLLKDHQDLEICFTPFGSRLGRKIVAKWRGS